MAKSTIQTTDPRSALRTKSNANFTELYDGAAFKSAENVFSARQTFELTSSPGAGINHVLYAHADYASVAGESGFGMYGRFSNSSTFAPVAGEHLVGVLGRAGDTVASQITMYGAESRVDAAGLAAEYGAHFNLGLFGGSTFSGTLNGILTRSEIYTDGTYTSPLNEGVNIGHKVAPLVGGAIKRSFVAFDPVQVNAEIGSYDATGTHRTAISHDGSNGFLGCTVGDLTIITAARTLLLSVVAALNEANSYGKGQVSKQVTLTDGATITPVLADAQVFEVTLGGNRTMADPSDLGTLKVGQHVMFIIKQDGTGSRTLTWGSAYEFEGGTAPTLSAAANAKDVIAGYVDSATSIIMGDLIVNLS
jgi:hypothetical protein